MSTAVIVGGGPNGLTAAILLAQQGVHVTVLEAANSVGGGVRSGAATGPGLIHDYCSAIHPMAVGSPVLAGLDLEKHGLQWLWPEVDCAHPLDDGSCGVLYRDVAATADGLGRDGRRWRALFERPARNFDLLAADIMGPLLRVPRHPWH
ncbi:FAD binding domain protein [Mycobacteroides abscessus subsp. bolletii 1513]|uniref:FAD binding domain protein n=1 Tax=Mycobacteroides abscessus subsp. bolletii 1513 TaxID=1299321 RepID=X8DG43_9MYCO|nr:FAD binding domain protein [Mycobacteroides abscessus subsp. bolletii 1513]